MIISSIATLAITVSGLIHMSSHANMQEQNVGTAKAIGFLGLAFEDVDL